MSIDKLMFEVHKLYVQKPTDKDYFMQIHDVIENHAPRITLLNRSLKSEIAQVKATLGKVKSDIAQNASLATHNDGLIKQGLSLLETQVTANGAATA